VILLLQYRNHTISYRNVKLVVDQEGRTVTDAQFRGSWLLVYFAYTLCPDACPSDIDPAMCAKVQAIFITVDPERVSFARHV
jgi:protein SCO1/2